MLLLALACSHPTSDVNRANDSATDTTSDSVDSADTADIPVEWTDSYDVVVVGSGPAGIAAALTARASGASVLLLDRDDVPGWGIVMAGLGFAVGTHWQAERGIEDSVAIAAAEWPDITGASADSGGVMDFLEHSAENLEWLESYGMQVDVVAVDRDAGVVARTHSTGWSYEGEHPLLAAYDGDLRNEVEVTAPVMEDGAVIGVRWTDLATGYDGATKAGAVVIATGGFMRNLDEIERVKPGTLARHPVFETNLQSNGGGLPFLRAVNAGSIAPGNLGVYVHSIQDPWMAEGESLLAIGIESGILVDANGERFIDEGYQKSFDLFNALPEGEVYEVFTDPVAGAVQFSRPGYNWSVSTEREAFRFEEVAPVSEDIFIGGSVEELATFAGINPEGLAQTAEDWNSVIAVHGTDPFGRDLTGAQRLNGTTWYAVRLSPGLAKNFGGVATDLDAEVLDTADVPIPGLYAAGEVVGMILGGGGGDGFTGSMNACYYGGRVAGANAASYAALHDDSSIP
jgi:fumarate reductase flavoprotein subunit